MPPSRPSSRRSGRTRTSGTGSHVATPARPAARSAAAKPGARHGHERRPSPPFPEQHQERPGAEHAIDPPPKFEAPTYSGSRKFAGKVFFVTGGDSGIGRATAVLAAREGANVAIAFLPEERRDAEDTGRAIRQEGAQVELIAGDVRRSSFCDTAVRRVVGRFGRLDVLVNNAAYQQHLASIDELSDEQWNRTFTTNIYGYFYMARAALRVMGEGSAIVNVGSITGLQGSAALLDYASTKGAIHAFTKSLAQQLVPRHIRVNAVAPGPVWTPLNVADQPPEKVAQFGSKVPMQRPAQPEEIAPAILFLASDVDASYITGQVLGLLGGETTAG